MRKLPALLGAAVLILLPILGRTQDLYTHVETSTTGAGSASPNYNDTYRPAPSPLMVTVTNASDNSGTGLTVSASYGFLQASASGFANSVPLSASCSGDFSACCDLSPGAEVGFDDCLTITSPSLPGGTPVKVMVTFADTYGLQTSGSSTRPQCAPGEFIQAWFDAIGYWDNIPGPGSGAVIFSKTYSTTVGAKLTFGDSIGLWGEANGGSQGDCLYSSSINGSATSQAYVNILTPGAGYTSCSGTVYPQYHPVLYLLPIPPYFSGVAYWLDAGTNNYMLEECPDLSQANWVTNTSPVTSINGTNEVTVPLTSNVMYFRLMGQ